MPRKRRPYLPGQPFHITARAVERLPLFTDLGEDVGRIITETIPRSDASVLAYAVMPNHLHLVLVQGDAPLAQLMQPMLRRVAALVHRKLKRKERVFGQPFASKPCRDSHHLREAIVYTNLNRVRAGFATHENTPWTSHRYYATGMPSSDTDRAIKPVFQLFHEEESPAKQFDGYDRYVAYRLHTDECKLRKIEPMLELPHCPVGDSFWYTHFTSNSHQIRWSAAVRPDLRDIALATLETEHPELTMEELRSNLRCRNVSKARAEIVYRCATAGYASRAIAAFLRISDSRVSAILSGRRVIRLPQAVMQGSRAVETRNGPDPRS